MKHTLAILRALLIILGSSSMLHAQVFIPTQLERDWLNGLIPGVVNGDGIMDTLDPAIPFVDSVEFGGWLIGTMDLYGVGYLSALSYLQISNDSYIEGSFIRLERIPSSLRTLRIGCNGMALPIILPDLPSNMEELSIDQGGDPIESCSLSIQQMPGSIQELTLRNLNWVSWNGDPNIESLLIDNDANGLFSLPNGINLPTCQVNLMSIDLDGVQGVINLASTQCNSLSIHIESATGPILWPEEVDSIHMNGGPEQVTYWPSTLRLLNIAGSSLNCLPTLPDGIIRLVIEDTPNLSCLPNWPVDLIPEEFVQWIWEPGAEQFCSVLNTNCPGIYPGITGSVFVDLDNDGVQDSDEFRPAGASVQLQPSNAVVPCIADGSWEVGLPPSTYTITPSASYPYIQSYTPASHSASVPNMGDIDTDNHFAVTLIPNIQDLQAWIHAEPARPGFENRLFVNYQNYGTIPTNTTLTLQWDADQQWVGSSVAPSNVSGNTATWDLGTLAIAAEGLLTVDLSTLAAVPLDTPIEHLLTASPVLGDEAPYDNVAVYNDVVVGSYDPNDKLLSPAAMSPAQLQDPTARIEYTVRFQNTGTYLAERVVILDTLPEGLILESIQFLASSHPNTWYLTGGILHVIHNDIMLPDSTSDEPNSHGFIRFSIKPDSTLPNGSTVSNIAHIIFDFNAPIITPPAVFTVDVLASVYEVQRGTWSLWPNPTCDLLRLTATDGALANQPCVVRDITGRTVMTSNTSASGDLPVGTLANGTYTVQAKGLVEVLRFVKE